MLEEIAAVVDLTTNGNGNHDKRIIAISFVPAVDSSNDTMLGPEAVAEHLAVTRIKAPP